MASNLDRYPRDHEARREFLSRNLNRVAHALGGALYAHCLDQGSNARRELYEDLLSVAFQGDILAIINDDRRFYACAVAIELAAGFLAAEEYAPGTTPEWHKCRDLKDYIEAGIEHASDGVLGERTPEWECDRAMRMALGNIGQIDLPVAIFT